MNKIKISKMEEVFRYLDQYTRDYFFRGVTNATHKLVPRIGRHPSFNKLNKVKEVEEDLLRRFKRRARPFLPESAKDEWEFLALAQHHGLPTRLLDWSRNPLVALYFAVQKNKNDDCAVYVLKRDKYITAPININPFK